MAKTKKKGSIIGKLLGIVFLSIAIVAVAGIGKMVIEMIELRQQNALVDKELEEIKQENDRLTSTKTKLEDPNYVQTYAKGEYMFSSGDDKIFYLPSSEE